MSRTLKQLCDDALQEVGFSTPSTYVGNSDDTAQQMVRIFTSTGDALYKTSPPFSNLVAQDSITLADGTQTYNLASDFGHMLPETMWDTTDDRLTLGPVTNEEYAYETSWGVVNGLNLRWRIQGRTISAATDAQLFDVVFSTTIGSGEDGNVLTYRYVKQHWLYNGTTGQSVPSTDDDQIAFNDELFTKGLIWRFLRAKGFPWETQFQEYTNDLLQAQARNGGMRKVRFIRGNGVLGTVVPDRGFGS